MNLIMAFIIVIVSYLIGSIPFSWLLVRRVKKIDLRNFGSGNIGATNARRAAGSRWGIIALIGDILKGVLPVFGAALIVANSTPSSIGWLPGAVGVAAIMGHIFPIYFRFKPSGKGVATAIGSFLILMPLAAGVMLVVLVAAVTVSRRMSVGSMLGMVVLPLAGWLIYHDFVMLTCSLWVAAIVILRHKDNIGRLCRGIEPMIGNSTNS